MIECPHCGAPNRPDSKFCGECGQLMGTPRSITCPLCDTANPPGILVCTECGAALVPPGVSPAEIPLETGGAGDGGTEQEALEAEIESAEEPSLDHVSTGDEEPEEDEGEKEPVPPWLQKLKGIDTEEPGSEGEREAGLEARQLPGWLEVPPEYEEMLSQASADGDESGAKRGDIPSWLDQLKPEDEGTVPETEESEDRGEPSGVLKGIPGTLGIEPVLAVPRRASPTVPGPLSSATDERGELFASVVREPARPAIELAVPRRMEKWTASGARWISYLVLLAAVIIPLLLGSRWSVANLSPTDAAIAMYQTIEFLPPDAVVLVSHDYDPGVAGEMIPQVRAVVDHLMRRGIRLINVSLTPEGTRLSEQLLSQAAMMHGYRPEQDYVSLGYVMGIEAGPRAVVEGLLAGQAGDLASGVEDISLVLEFAGAPEYLRLWLEQVQGPYGLPMVAGVSGTADPFARPYLRNESRQQLSGLITGFVGAAEYERLSGVEGLAVAGMDAQSFGHVAIILLIVVGNVAYFSQKMSARLSQ